MRALITGGAGFVGQWLARALLHRGDHVIAASVQAHPSHAVLNAA